MFPATKHLRSLYRDVCLAMAQEIRCKDNDFFDRMTTKKHINNEQNDKKMKKIIYLALIAVVLGCFSTSCEKENMKGWSNQTSESVNLKKITMSNGMLDFPSWESYIATIEDIGEACENRTQIYVDSLIEVLGTDDDETLNDAIQKNGFNPFQPLHDFAKSMGFTSMYSVLEDLEKKWMEDPNSTVEDNPFMNTELERYQSALHNIDGNVMIAGEVFKPDQSINSGDDCRKRDSDKKNKLFTYKNKNRLVVGKISAVSAYLSASTTLYTITKNGNKILWTSGIYVAAGGQKWYNCDAGDVPHNILHLDEKSKNRMALCHTSVIISTHSFSSVIIPYPASLLSSHAATKVAGAYVNLGL